MKKEFKQIDSFKDEDIELVEETTNKMNKIFYRKIIVSISVTILLTLFTIILYNNASQLSVVSREFYLLIILFSLLFFIGVFVKYYFLKDKNIDNLKIKYKIYSIFDLIGFIVNGITITTFLLLFVFSTAKVSGDSMNNTYKNNDTILVWTLFYTPEKDDVVVINSKKLIYNTNFIIKRIVATENDTVALRLGKFYVNDVYIQDMSLSEYEKILTDVSSKETFNQVPKDYYIVLGDNRDNSQDSRTMGLVHKDEIVGKSTFRILPLSSIGIPKKDVENGSEENGY